MPKQTIRIFLVDDHEVVRRGIRHLLESETDLVVVGEAATAAEALTNFAGLDVDVAVVDARLPDGSGIDVCREIRTENPRTAVIILTSYDDDEALFSAIMAGAAGYVLKQVRGNDLVDAVRRVATGQSLLDPAVTQRVLERIRSASEADPLNDLSPKERTVLRLVGKGLTNKEIADEMSLAEKTVKNYVSQLLSKLGMQRRTQIAVLAAQRNDLV